MLTSVIWWACTRDGLKLSHTMMAVTIAMTCKEKKKTRYRIICRK